MTARTIARARGEGKDLNEMTAKNVEKVTRYRPNGEEALEKMVEKMNKLRVRDRDNAVNTETRWGGKI
jgi:uncharacterized FlaG/YvyC family protein